MGDALHHDDELATRLRWLIDTVAGRASLTCAVTLLGFAIAGSFAIIFCLAGIGWTLAPVFRRLARTKPDPIVEFERERAERARLVFTRVPPEERPARKR